MALKIHNGSTFKQAESFKLYTNAWKKVLRSWTYNGSQWRMSYPEYPLLLINPQITATVGSIGRLGSTYFASTGSWRAGDAYAPTSYSYQWNRNGIPISGATSSTYTTTSSDVEQIIGVTVTANNGRGATPVTVTTGTPELPSLTAATIYDSTVIPGAPGSVSLSTGTGTYSGSWTVGTSATTYEGTTTNGTCTFNYAARTFSGTGTSGNVQVSVRSVNSNRQVTMIWNHVLGAASYEIWVGNFGAGSPWQTISASGYAVGQSIVVTYTGASTSLTAYTIAPRSTNYQGYAIQSSITTANTVSAYTASNIGTIQTLSAFTYSISDATATPSTPTVSPNPLTSGFSSNRVDYSWNQTSNTTYWSSSISGGPEGNRSNNRYQTSDFWPTTPGNLYTVSVYSVNDSKQATISWTSSTGASSYTVNYVVDGSAGSQSNLTGNSITLSGTNISVSSVTAFSSSGGSRAGTLSGSSSVSLSSKISSTNSSSGTHPQPAPAAPTGLTANSGGSSSISFYWDAMANATSYDIYYNSTNYNPGNYVDFNQTGTSKTLSGLASGVTWYVWVRSQGPGGTSSWSGPAIASTTSGTTAPGVPSVSNNYDGYINGFYQWTLTISQGSGGDPTGYDWELQLGNSSSGPSQASSTGSVSGSGTRTVTRNSSVYTYARWRARATNSAGTSSYSSYTPWL